MIWTVAELIEATQGKLLQGEPNSRVASICTDTRNIQAEDCFLALRGEHHDGHDFIAAALNAGVAALILSQDFPLRGVHTHTTVIAVRDTLYALGELARHKRRKFRIPFVGIGGSNGKTSTKEMVACILGQHKKILKNYGNFNNLIGVPLTLLSLNDRHEAAVIEMGINVPGEMMRLAEIVEPTIGLLTNIHPAHLEGLRSLDGIMEEKGQLLNRLGSENVAVINMDDDRLLKFSDTLASRKLFFSAANPSADVRMIGPVESQDGHSLFKMSFGSEVIPVRLPVLGLHQVQNALAAAAVASAMGSSPEEISAGLAKHQPVSQRMQTYPLPGGGVLVDDTYNANPRSMIAAVQSTVSASRKRPVIAVLGEMRELGVDSAILHRSVGREVARIGVQQIITLGEMGKEIAAGAQETGMPGVSCHHFGNHTEAVAWLRENRPPDAWVLVKGSRGMTMERIVEGILNENEKSAHQLTS